MNLDGKISYTRVAMHIPIQHSAPPAVSSGELRANYTMNTNEHKMANNYMCFGYNFCLISLLFRKNEVIK